MDAIITPFFHAPTFTWTWLVEDPATRAAAIIDPALDFDPKSCRIETLLADALVAHIHERKLELLWILETHLHADHLSAAQYLKQQLGGQVGAGAGLLAVQQHFTTVFNLGAGFATDGSQFDHHFVDGERFSIGSLPVEVMATPGHTPCSVCYRIGDALFIGDTLFAPDVGSARCDFPGGDAAVLWRSIQRILASGDDIRLCLAHDYPGGGRDPLSAISVAQMRERNIHLVGIDEAAYVALRQARDATLPAPQLLFPSLQVNIRAGQLPPPDDNGVRYLRLPLRGGW